MNAQLEVGGDSVLERSCALVLELGTLVPRDRVLEIRERGAVPQGQRLSQELRRRRRRLTVRFFDQPLESFDVERARLDDDQVTRSSRDDGVATQRFPELRNVDLQRSRSRVGRRAVPERVDQAVARDNAVRLQEEKGEQRALLRAAKAEQPAALDDLQRTEDPELDARLRPPLATL